MAQIWYAVEGMRRWAAGLRLIGVGWFIGGSIVLGLVAGRWLDSKLNTEPVFIILGLIIQGLQPLRPAFLVSVFSEQP